MTATALVPVEFHGSTLYAITVDGVHHVALRPICDALGIDWEAQRQRIKRNPVLTEGACVMKAPSAGGEQETLTLPLSMLNGWLFGVSVNRVKPELRENLIRYQRECFDVLAQHFMPAARPHNPALDYDRISPAQRQDLKEIVDAIVKEGIQTYGETWARLQKKFRVNAYAELSATQHLEARQYLIAKLPGGYAGEVEAELPGKLPEAIASSAPTLRNRRWLLATDFEGREVVQPIPDDASIISFTKDSYYGIVERIPMERLPDMLAELQKRVACHIGAFSQHLQRNNAKRGA